MGCGCLVLCAGLGIVWHILLCWHLCLAYKLMSLPCVAFSEYLGELHVDCLGNLSYSSGGIHILSPLISMPSFMEGSSLAPQNC